MRRARTLRSISTPAERRLWRLLFPFRTGGFHFRKQVPVGPYFADFACHHVKLVIEVDGGGHGSQAGMAHDLRRDAFMRSKGFEILRFANRDVIANPDGVFAVISDYLSAYAPHSRHHPSPALPVKGRVKGSGATGDTLPLAGRDGEGVSGDTQSLGSAP